jgi:hypothetical protein
MDDPFWPEGHALVTRKRCWKFKSLGAAPHIAKPDGKALRLEEGGDTLGGYMRCWGNLLGLNMKDSHAIKW